MSVEREDYLSKKENMKNDFCVYCEERKTVVEHNGELICKDCRIDLVEQDFEMSAHDRELEEKLRSFYAGH